MDQLWGLSQHLQRALTTVCLPFCVHALLGSLGQDWFPQQQEVTRDLKQDLIPEVKGELISTDCVVRWALGSNPGAAASWVFGAGMFLH